MHQLRRIIILLATLLAAVSSVTVLSSSGPVAADADHGLAGVNDGAAA